MDEDVGVDVEVDVLLLDVVEVVVEEAGTIPNAMPRYTSDADNVA